MATELAKAYVQIIPSAKGITGGIQKAIDPEASPAGNSFGGKMVGMIKKVIATAAIGKALSASISEGAALQQSLGGIETLFKDSADKVKQNAANAYRTAGMSANEYMELTTSFSASLLQSLGNDTAKAADVADMAMTDMSDNANKMGTNMEDIKNAYQGFAKQNYTMLDNLKLGYGGTKEEMQRLLSDAQKITGVKYDINNLSDVYSAIHVIQGELDITGTTAKEASSTISGSFDSMKAAFKNVMGEIALGIDVGPAIRALAGTLVTFLVGNLLPAIWNILSSLPGALVAFVQALGPELSGAISSIIPQITSGITNGIPQMITAGSQIITQICAGIQTQLPIILQNGVEIVSNIVNGILQNIPGLISTAGSMISTLISTISSALPQILSAGAQILLNIVHGIINNLPQIVSAAANVIARLVSSIGQNLPQILQSGIEIIGKLAAGLIRAIPTLVGKIPEIIKSIQNAFSNVDWGNIGINIISGIANGLRNAASQLWDAVKGVLGSFKDNVLSFFGIHSPSRWGIYVGKMIDAGFAKGVAGNLAMVTNATNELRKIATTPFESGAMSYSVNASREKNGNETIGRLDTLISIMRVLATSGKEIHVSIGEREFIRLLRDMGVVFA